MDRPVMIPRFSEPAKKPRRSLGEILLLPVRALAWLLLLDLSPRRKHISVPPATLGHVMHDVLHGLLFAPALLPLVVAGLVYIGTHPQRTTSPLDPVSRGVYYDPVAFVTSDDVRLEGWLVPVVDEQSILRQKESALQARRPAVVLVHDGEGDRSQMLPLVKPLRDAGYVVFVTSLRLGTGGDGSTTFGVREALDVNAALDLIRRRPGVDSRRVALIGTGTGANAAALAARSDTDLAALILDHPTRDVDVFLGSRLAPPQRWLKWLSPFCRWGFEMAYRVDADDLDISRHLQVVSARPSLVFDTTTGASPLAQSDGISSIIAFLNKHMMQSPQASTDHR